jgi:drug/metabolite transporter (DMT)-like permease
MTDKQLALFIGGFTPAILFGVAAVFLKVANRDGVGTGPYLMAIGATVLAMGALFTLWDRDYSFSAKSACYIGLYGVVWSVAMICVAIALKRYHAQIGQLVSIYNMNTLVTVLIGLVVLSEWRNVNPVKLTIAAILISLGGIFAATA